jgi:hypothetical protein
MIRKITRLCSQQARRKKELIQYKYNLLKINICFVAFN